MRVPLMLSIFEQHGLSMAGVTDHLYADTDCTAMYHDLKQQIAQVPCATQVFVGAEIDQIAPARLSHSFAQTAIFDYRMVACTHYQSSEIVPPKSFDYGVIASDMIRRHVLAAEATGTDIIAHPFYARGLSSVFEGFSLPEAITAIPDHQFDICARALAKRNVAAEINSGVLNDAYGPYIRRFFLSCKRHGVRFSIGSDAHSQEWLCQGQNMRDYIEELGITSQDIWLPTPKAGLLP